MENEHLEPDRSTPSILPGAPTDSDAQPSLPEESVANAEVTPEVTAGDALSQQLPIDVAPANTAAQTDVSEADIAALPVVEEDGPEAGLKHETSHKKRAALVLGGFFIFNALLLGMNYYLVHAVPQSSSKSAAVSSKQGVVSSSASPSPTQPADAPSQPTTIHYKSTGLNLEFDYPVDWRVSSSTDNTSVSLTSGLVSFTDYEGIKQSGKINMSIAAKSVTPSQFSSFAANAYLTGSELVTGDSIQITYSNPSAVQRKQTNLTYVRDSNFYDKDQRAIDATAANLLMVTGKLAYKQGQTIGSQNYNGVDPQIATSIDQCHSNCQGPDAAALTPATWDSNPDLKIIKTIIASIRITQ